MEKKLSKLFDFQKYAENSDLAAIINEVEARYPDAGSGELSDDELDMIAAAGRPELGYQAPQNKKDEREK